MKSQRFQDILLIILVFLGVAAVCIGSTVASPDARLILAYHAKTESSHQAKDAAWLDLVCKATERAALLLNVSKHTQVLEAMWDVESEFDPKAESSEGCLGITQINRKDLPYFYKRLVKVMPYLPPLKDVMKFPECQIALGVMAFKCKLQDAHGNLWEGVRRYNGRGLAAERYKKKVQKLHRLIFKRIHHVGETAAPRPGAKQGAIMKKAAILGMVLMTMTPMIALRAQEVPEAQAVEVSETAAPATTQVLRDHNFKQYPCYGCPGDVSMTNHIPAIVKAQKKAYAAAHDKYKATWALADVQEASRLAFTSPVAAWPYYNYANHLVETSGDLDAATKALDKAEALMKGFDGPIVEEITDLIASRREQISKAEE